MLPYSRKNPLPFPFFRNGRRSPIAAVPSKGKVGVQRGRKTAGCPSFLPTAVGTASSPPRGAARSRRPQTANPPAEVQRKTLRPERANPPAAVRAPHSAGAEKEPPRQGEHADAVRAPRWVGAEKISRKFSKKLTIHGQFSPPSGIGLKEVMQ